MELNEFRSRGFKKSQQNFQVSTIIILYSSRQAMILEVPQTGVIYLQKSVRLASCWPLAIVLEGGYCNVNSSAFLISASK
jgi:hypothetical protein